MRSSFFHPAAAVFAAAVLIAPVAAFAHPELKSSTPAAKSTVAAPATLQLHFAEPLELKLSGVNLTLVSMMMSGKMTTHNLKIDTTAVLDPKDPKTLIVTPKTPLSSGNYKVAWHATSVDTHRLTGTYTFTVK